MKQDVDVLCVGHASYDLVFSLDHHPEPDEKTFASRLFSCGGGPAANAAVTVSRLGYTAAFAGYLGDDFYGQKHFQEFQEEGVLTNFIVRGPTPTPLSVVLVKPDGRRTVVNFKGNKEPLDDTAIDFSACHPRVILFDGHEPFVSLALIGAAGKAAAVTVLDAGSVHDGTRKLLGLVDYVVASEKFARDFTGEAELEQAANKLCRYAACVVVTGGEAGLVWAKQEDSAYLPAFSVDAVDTTGAGDAFHGAFAAGLAAGKNWQDLLRYSSAVAALCCTGYGARLAIPTAREVMTFLERH